MLPPLGPVREQMTGSADPLEPDRFLAFLEAELERLADDGGFATIVLHPFMLELVRRGAPRRAARPGRRGGPAGELWVAPCREVAAHVLADPAAFAGGTDARLDQLVAASGYFLRGRRRPSGAGSRGRRGGASSAACGAPASVSIRTGRRIASIQAASSGR